MEFLKKHYEKIAVAIVSLMMIATAVILAGNLGIQNSEIPNVDKIPKGGEATPLNTNELLQITALLRNPPAWQTNDGQRPFIPDIWEWNGKDIYRPSTYVLIEDKRVIDPADELAWTIAQRTFPMKFMAVVSEGVFQINIANGGSKFVKVGDAFKQIIFGAEETFTVLRYNAQKIKQFDRKLGQEREVDVSTLTLQRKSAEITKEIPLVVGKTVSESEPVGRCASSVTGQTFDNLKVGSKVVYKGKQYEVLSLDTYRYQVIFKDVQSKKTYTKPANVVARF